MLRIPSAVSPDEEVGMDSEDGYMLQSRHRHDKCDGSTSGIRFGGEEVVLEGSLRCSRFTCPTRSDRDEKRAWQSPHIQDSVKVWSTRGVGRGEILLESCRVDGIGKSGWLVGTRVSGKFGECTWVDGTQYTDAG